MPFLFCQQCGTKNTYQTVRPNFCMSCGASFGSSGVCNNEEKPEQVQHTETDPPNFLNLKKLDYEIINQQIDSTTLGSVMKEQKLGLGPRRKPKSKTGDPIKDSMDLCKPAKEPIDLEDK